MGWTVRVLPRVGGGRFYLFFLSFFFLFRSDVAFFTLLLFRIILCFAVAVSRMQQGRDSNIAWQQPTRPHIVVPSWSEDYWRCLWVRGAAEK